MIARNSARLAALAALPAILTFAAAAPSLADDHIESHQIDLKPLNDSGATGTVWLSLEGQEMTVKVEAEGLVPGQPHAQHLHGSTDGHDFQCPDESADKDGDGIINNTEATVHYGDINISLTTDGDTSAEKSGLAVDRMPKADAEGKLSYERTIPVSQDVVDQIKDLHVVQHGIDPNGNKQYDFEGAGKSELDPKLPQEATAPANCGIVKGAAIGSVPVGGVETGGEEAAESTLGTPSVVAMGSGMALIGVAGVLTAARQRNARLRKAVAGRSQGSGA
ncbi:hypothetical protein [Streptomyces sp. 8N616]|uniref:hypothetical protein n=1 Tax=Streptomyces sp. 8N616 TaxID=3457414 RepID=UPI003FD0ED89